MSKAAAPRSRIPSPPDTGTLQGDVLALLRQMSASVGEVAAVLSFVIADCFTATGRSPSDLRERATAGDPSTMAAIIARAVGVALA